MQFRLRERIHAFLRLINGYLQTTRNKGPLLTHAFSTGGRSKQANYLSICNPFPQRVLKRKRVNSTCDAKVCRVAV